MTTKPKRDPETPLAVRAGRRVAIDGKRGAQFQTSKYRREPIVVEFTPDDDHPDGRRWEFAPDMSGEDWIEINIGVTEVRLTEIVLGELYDDVVANTTGAELRDVTSYLFDEYATNYDTDEEPVGAGEPAAGD